MAIEPSHPARVIDTQRLGVRGVVIGSLRSAVVQQLGKPARVTRGYDDEMGTGHWEELRYSGLLIEVINPVPGYLKKPLKEPYTSRIVISSKRWHTESGIAVGASIGAVTSKFGPSETTEVTGNVTRMWYSTAGFDGRVVFRFKNGVLAEITVEEDWT